MMDYEDMLEQVDALAVGMTPAERRFVDVLMDLPGTLTPAHHAEIQRLYDRFVKPYGYNQPPEGSGTMSDALEYNALPEQSIDAHIVEVCKTLAWWQRRMEAKIQKNKHKGFWREAEINYLVRRLHQEVLELSEALGTEGDVVDECVDVTNFAMMLADVWRQTHGETPHQDMRIISP